MAPYLTKIKYLISQNSMTSYLTNMKCITYHKIEWLFISQNNLPSIFNTLFIPIRNNIRYLSATISNDAHVWKHALDFVMKFVTSDTEGDS